jgi:hypothetical protein
MNKTFLYFSIFICSISTLNAQNGCTDTLATNYDASAVTNDGTCIYQNLGQIFTLKGDMEPKVQESSGIELIDGYIWTHNDSGNSNQIYKVNPSTGEILQSVSITGYYNNDWEDITSDDQYLYIGDFGNNNGNRQNLMILKVNKNDLSNNAASFSVTAEAINISYSDQTTYTTDKNNNFNCEAFFTKGDSLYLFSKNSGDFKTKVYAVTKTPGSYVLSPKYEYDSKGLITGADYDAIKNEIILIGYEDGHYSSFIYYLNDFSENNFFDGDVKRVMIGTPTIGWQTEGICFGNNHEIYISCENSSVKASLYLGYQNELGFLGLEKFIEEQSNLFIYPNPVNTGNDLKISTIHHFNSLKLIGIDGKVVIEKSIQNDVLLSQEEVSTIQKGIYILMISSEEQSISEKIHVN